MRFALDTREHFLDVVQAADQTGPEVEARRAKRLSGSSGLFHGVEARPERLVDHGFHRKLPAAGDLIEPGGHVLFER